MTKRYSEMTPEERKRSLAELVSLREVMGHLGVREVPHVYVLMSEKKLPGWLVDGTWKFHKQEIDEWVTEIGGREQIAAHLADWEARKTAGEAKR